MTISRDFSKVAPFANTSGGLTNITLTTPTLTTPTVTDGSFTTPTLTTPSSTGGTFTTPTLTTPSSTGGTFTTPLVTGGKETQVAMAANDIDLAAGNYFTKTIAATTTFTVSNIPTSGQVASFILVLTNAGSQTINWSTSFGGSNLIKWAGGTAPTLTASGVDSLGFYTFNGGTTWTGLVLGKDIK